MPTKTLEAIDAALRRDQGARYRGLLRELMPLAEDAYRDTEESFRPHLGASLIGRECARELWYSFRWFKKPAFDGRMLRLFNRGHLEEPRLVALLRMIGCQVWQYTDSGMQYRIEDCHGHFGGSLDAVILGLPEMPQVASLGEFKTHGEKSFEKLKKEGVLKAKWEHFIQMQQYMGKMNLPRALYLAVNKNTDEIYGEVVAFDQVQYQRYLERAGIIIFARQPPPRISETPGFYKCKCCDFSSICHLGSPGEKNCRTCRHSAPVAEGAWNCEAAPGGYLLTKQHQLAGCSAWEKIL